MEEMRQIRAEVEGVSLSDGTMVIVKRWVNLAVEPRAEELVDAKNITLEAIDASVRMWQAYNHFCMFSCQYSNHEIRISIWGEEIQVSRRKESLGNFVESKRFRWRLIFYSVGMTSTL